jgi:hypothetical protein
MEIIKTDLSISPKQVPPESPIATDVMRRNYIKHLVNRYNEFAMRDRSKGKFAYGFIYAAVNREFSAKWDMIPLIRFSDVCMYLQGRIDRPIIGKVRKK